MRINHRILGGALFFTLSCSLWEYDDPSSMLENEPPETYLSLIANDTIYATVTEVIEITDPVTGETVFDTIWSYAIDEEPDPSMVWDTLTSAFSTITSSRQEWHWWGEDKDGDVIGYYYKWNTDPDWTFTTRESALFYVPVTTDLDVFSFEVKAMDNDSLVDRTPAGVVLPIRNSPPSISFRYRSNPLVTDIYSDTSFTFPTRTMVWDVQDQDGIETVIDVFYALDDTCDTCWERLDAASYSSITLTDLEPGFHTFYLKTRDIAGAESKIIHFPDSDNPNESDYWKVKPVSGDLLLVDDFPQDENNRAQAWYRTVMDSILGSGNYSVWEIGDVLPYSTTDISANLAYFDHVIWYSAYTGIETYSNASSNIYNYLLSGGNVFINTPELKDSTFTWFPMDSTFVLNPNGRLMSGRFLESTIASDLDLQTSSLIAIRVKGFVPDIHQFAEVQDLYRLAEPGTGDQWSGTPAVCSLGQFQVSQTQLSGKIVLMTIPLHNGSTPLLEGNGSAGKFLDYLIHQEFIK